jgi:putative glutamine amidotransferase
VLFRSPLLDEGSELGLSDLDTTAVDLSDGASPPPPPTIAISAPKPRDRDCARMPVDYISAIRRAGGVPLVLSTHAMCAGEHTPEGIEMRDNLAPQDTAGVGRAAGLLLTGGGDVDPAFYGEEPHARTYNVSPRRDRFEFGLLERALELDMPVLAICRGMQVLNVYLGGTLEQHLLDTSGRLDHYRDRPRAEVAHLVHLRPGTQLADWLGERVSVNSHHHQGLGVVADALQEAGRAEDGVLEAVVSQAHSWVVGVQWHPEAMVPLDDTQLALFKAFVEAAERFARLSVRARSV